MIEPRPPLGQASLPWDVPAEDPVAAIAADRDALGDTFTVESGGMTYLFLFSAAGVRVFYELDEAVASKGIADMRMLGRKVPPQLFAERRTIPHDMFTRELAEAYGGHVTDALRTELALLGDAGTVETFAFTRRLGHRFGLASWGGPGAGQGERFDRLVDALDRLDPAASFVNPEAMAAVAASDHADERAALDEIAAAYAAVIADHDAAPEPGMFATIVERWAGSPERVRGIAHDVALVHLGSMSNLFAAVGWAIVHVAQRPELAGSVAGDRDLAERCALESIRLAQRSIMLREVLQDTTITVDGVSFDLARGTTLATLLPLTNTSAAPGLDRFDPDRWRGRRLGDTTDLAARELVTTFGHGSHTCPAQPFSLRVMVDTLVALFGRFEITLLDPDPRPRRGQIGGVARSEEACRLAYRARP